MTTHTFDRYVSLRAYRGRLALAAQAWHRLADEQARRGADVGGMRATAAHLASRALRAQTVMGRVINRD